MKFRFAALPLLLLAACRTPVEKMVRVDATPAGCVVLVDGLMVGVTPCNYVVPRRGELQFEVLPPRDNKDELFVQKMIVHWKKLPATGAVLYFDLRLDKTTPLQRYEVRDR